MYASETTTKSWSTNVTVNCPNHAIKVSLLWRCPIPYKKSHSWKTLHTTVDRPSKSKYLQVACPSCLPISNVNVLRGTVVQNSTKAVQIKSNSTNGRWSTDKVVLYGGDWDGVVAPLPLVDQVTVELVLPCKVKCHAVLLHVNLSHHQHWHSQLRLHGHNREIAT